MTAPAPRILLVVNGDAELSAKRQVLGRAGFDVESALTATEALGLLARRRYAAIIADGCVPDLPPLDWLARDPWRGSHHPSDRLHRIGIGLPR